MTTDLKSTLLAFLENKITKHTENMMTKTWDIAKKREPETREEQTANLKAALDIAHVSGVIEAYADLARFIKSLSKEQGA